MTSLANIDELRDSFELLDSWEDRYSYLIDLGRGLPPMPDGLKVDAHKVEGCMSQVWMVGRRDDGGRLRFDADSDAMIVKGLIAVLMLLYSEQRPEAILDTDVKGVFEELGLQKHISVNRRNGFYAMVERIKMIARHHAA